MFQNKSCFVLFLSLFSLITMNTFAQMYDAFSTREFNSSSIQEEQDDIKKQPSESPKEEKKPKNEQKNEQKKPDIFTSTEPEAIISTEKLNSKTDSISKTDPIKEEADKKKKDDEENTTTKDTSQEPLPTKKTDRQIQTELSAKPKNYDEMTDEEKNAYSDKLLEDRFIVMSTNFKTIPTRKSDICSFELKVKNNSARLIKMLTIIANINGNKQPATFRNIKPRQLVSGAISLTGKSCKNFELNMQYDVSDCEVDGLNENQCKMRLFIVP